MSQGCRRRSPASIRISPGSSLRRTRIASGRTLTLWGPASRLPTPAWDHPRRAPQDRRASASQPQTADRAISYPPSGMSGRSTCPDLVTEEHIQALEGTTIVGSCQGGEDGKPREEEQQAAKGLRTASADRCDEASPVE